MQIISGHDMSSAQRKVAVVTGGSGGVGSATCSRLGAAGHTVIVLDRSADQTNALVAELVRQGVDAQPLVLDLSNRQATIDGIRGVIDRHGGIDILVNNAAALDVMEKDLAATAIDPDVWDYELQVNLTAPMLLAREVIPGMIARGGGALVHVASTTALRAEDVRTGYSASKSGLLALSRAIAVQYGKQGVRSNVVSPGLVLTPLAHSAFSPEMRSLFLDHHMSPRLGRPEDVAAAIAFLSCDDSAFINGAMLPVDGGYTAYLGVVPALRRLAEQHCDNETRR